MNKLELSQNAIGRIIKALHPEMVKDILKDYTPLTDDIAIIPSIHNAVDNIFPDLSEFDKKVMFIAVIYRSFRPHSFLPPLTGYKYSTRSAAGKLPSGVRSAIARCLGFNNPEMSSHYKTFAEAHIKNPRYRAKMKQITDYLGLTPQLDGSRQEYNNQPSKDYNS